MGVLPSSGTLTPTCWEPQPDSVKLAPREAKLKNPLARYARYPMHFLIATLPTSSKCTKVDAFDADIPWSGLGTGGDDATGTFPPDGILLRCAQLTVRQRGHRAQKLALSVVAVRLTQV